MVRTLFLTKIISIDPGVHLCAWAYLREFRIQMVGLESDKIRGSRPRISNIMRAFTLIGASIQPDVVIVERPVVYAMEKQKGDQNDLIRVAEAGGIAGAACAALSPNCELLFIEPRKWKGTIDKEVHNERTAERNPYIVPQVDRFPKGKRNHIWDAVALALWQMERTRKR